MIWFGKKFAGRIDECHGQFAATRFLHVYGLPLVPLDAMWVTEVRGKMYRGVPIGIPLRSMLAGWLRTTGLLAGLACLLLWSEVALGQILAGVGLLGAVIGSWTWRRVSGRVRGERIMFGSVTGLFADPQVLPAEVALGLRRSLEATWAKRASGLTPREVARHGPKEPGRAAAAYCLLMLSARDADARRAGELRALARNIIDQKFEAAASPTAGPYRTAAPTAPIQAQR